MRRTVRRTGWPRGHARWVAALALVAAGAYAAWAPWSGAPTPAPSPAPSSAAQACGTHAPDGAVPVGLPVVAHDAWRALEGRLVCFEHDLVVTEVYELGRTGELRLADRRLFADGTGLEVEDPTLHVVRLGAERRPAGGSVRPLPWGLEVGDVRVGDAVVALVGHVRRGAAGDALIVPTAPPTFESRNPRTERPEPVDGALRVAAFNLEHYFLTLGARGANHAAALERQTAKLVAALVGLDADVVAVMEVERDDDGAALRALAAALNARLEDDARAAGHDAPERRYRALPEPPRSAARPGDAIRQGFLIDEARVAMVALDADLDAVHERPPQALTLEHRPSGERVTVVAVHLRSKGGCPSSGDVDLGFGCWNQRRLRQADALARFAATLEAHHPDAGVLLVGDFNAHRFEPPILRLADDGWLLVADLLPDEAAVSYVFFGLSAALDHALASPRLRDQVVGAAYWAINADEPPLAAAGREAAAPPGFRPDPFRSSDHDPLVVGLFRSPDAGGERAPRRRAGAPRTPPRRGTPSGTGSAAPRSRAPRPAAPRSRGAGRSTCTGRSTAAPRRTPRSGAAATAASPRRAGAPRGPRRGRAGR